MAAPSLQTSKNTVFHRIKLNGKQISTEIGLVSLSVLRNFNKVTHAQIVLTDGDVAKQDFALSNEITFLPGSDIEILLGYSNSASLDTVFKGVVTRHTIHAPEHGQSRLVLEAKDKAVLLTLVRKTRFFTDLKDKEIIQNQTEAVGLQAEIDGMDVQHRQMVMYDSLPWDFIVMRAEANGKLVSTDDGVLKIVSPAIAAKAHFKAQFGYNLYEIEAELDARRQLKKATTLAWDFTKQEVSSEQGESQLKEPGNLSSDSLADKLKIEELRFHAGHLGAQELSAWADAYAQQSRLSKTFGRARIRGDASLRIGQTLELVGAGARFNGLAFITGIAHHYQKGWETEIQFGWDHNWFYHQLESEGDSTKGLLPHVPGMQIGVVLNEGDENDPDFLVKIKLPLLDPDGVGIWARVLTPEAGNDHGLYLRPKQGDEVLVGFVANDPRYPVIMGCLYSREQLPGIASSGTEQKYGYRSAENQQLVFDDSAKTIKLETGNCSITLDGQGNKIELKVGGNTITIDQQNIEINATAQAVIKGGTIALN
ncbi:MAG: type VI secretion system tip protein VgrG [Saprospiraceae bacterium]|nr:type VI secretion system tip protein VgrG [Saprospiraceae bacterium]